MTTHTFATSAALALASAITLSAQTPTPTRPVDPAPTQASARADDKTMTVFGCLKPWDAAGATPAAPATTGAAGAMAGKFLLTNVVRFGAAGSTGATPPAQASAAGGTQYVVMAESNVNLAAHINHQVQITGTLSDQPVMSARRPGDAPAATPGESSTRPGMGNAVPHESATIMATAVTMVSATCTPASDEERRR